MKSFRLQLVIISISCFLNSSMPCSILDPNWITIKQPRYYYSSSAYTSMIWQSRIQTLTSISSSDWKLCYESEKIFIYERWIKITDNHYLREKKGEMNVKCSFTEAVKIISCYENLKSWMNGVQENTLIKRNSSTNWITYTIFSFPWPFENRDIVSEYHLNIITPGIYTQINSNSIDNGIKQKKGITRINNYKTSWNIKKINEQTVWITYIASCDNPPSVPRFIQDPILEKTFYQNLFNLRAFLEK